MDIYIHWQNRTPIIKAQIEKLLKITRDNMNLKEQHKEMKREVEILEQKRRVDRGSVSWRLLKEARNLN